MSNTITLCSHLISSQQAWKQHCSPGMPKRLHISTAFDVPSLNKSVKFHCLTTYSGVSSGYIKMAGLFITSRVLGLLNMTQRQLMSCLFSLSIGQDSRK